MPTSFLAAVSALRAAGEPTRLRMLALLARAELTVGEICEVLGQSQPRVSRHLKLLCDAGLLGRFREQHWVYYRAPAAGPARDTVLQLLASISDDDDLLRRDRNRMEKVIKERGERAADQLGSERATDSSAFVDAILLQELNAEPIGVLLDVGTGAGHLLELLGAKATRAVGVDISSDALRLARTKVHGAGLSHCELQQGDMYDLPFAAPLFDTATVDRVLARAERPLAALKEIARTLKYGGRLVIIEDFDVLSATSANPITQLREWCSRAGLECTRVHPVDTESAHLLVALARQVSQPVTRTPAAA
jgi:DNA-binding transcriptional ArsR family regulator/precorrin-6B methylase 2